MAPGIVPLLQRQFVVAPPPQHRPTANEPLSTEAKRHLIEMEKRYFGKLSFRAYPAMHAEQFKIQNVMNNEDLASVGA